MTIEEKAKAYDEALEQARQIKNGEGNWRYSDLIEITPALEEVFPVLRESDDERIRKKIIEYLEMIKEGCVICVIDTSEEIAWLEKQKERGPLTKEEEMTLQDIKLHLEDEGCPTKWKDLLHDIYCLPYEKQEDANKAIEAVDRIDKYIDEHLANAHDMKDSNPDKKYYRGWDDALGKMAGILQDVYSGEKGKEQKPRLIGEDSVEKMARQMYETGQTIEKQKPAEWSEKHIAGIFEKVGLAKIVREQGNDDLTNALQDAMLELSKVGNIEWSEEDERTRQNLMSLLANMRGDRIKEETYNKYYPWLKSLRPSWKPSEQEKGALRTAIHILTEERNFPKAASHLQAILDAFEGKESRKDWKPSEVQIKALLNAEKYLNAGLQYGSAKRIAELIKQFKKLGVKEEPEYYQHFDPDC